MPPALAAAPGNRQRLPDFLILGEMRCGSTTLWDLLSRHPRIFVPDEKELHFFNARPDKPLSLAEYARCFARAERGQLVGEATPNYLFDEEASARIHRIVPEARLIAILRDPVRRAWSHYWHNVRRGREPLSFERGLAAEPERIAGNLVSRLQFSYASRGHYVRSLQRYADRFGRDRLCVVLLEELSSQREVIMRGVFAHLGLHDEWPALGSGPAQRNRADFPRWPRLDRATRGLRRIAVEAPAWVGAPLLALGRLSRPLRTYSGQPRMNPDQQRKLRDVFADSDAELTRWLGRELPWSRASGA